MTSAGLSSLRLGYYKKNGQFHTSNPKAGDQIFFGTSTSNSSHTGLVEKVDSSKVYTIEGNTSNSVARRTYSLSDSSIIGYGRPAYDAEASTSTGGNSGSSTGSSTFSVGNIVNFTGTTHYSSASSTSAKTCKPGTAKITKISKGAKHPYHLIAEDSSSSNVYGWVDAADIKAVSNGTSGSSTAGTSSKKVTASNPAKSFLKSLAGTYTVKTALNCRDGAGTSYKSLVVMPKGTSVQNYGYYTTVSGVKWLYVQCVLDGTTYTGFASSSYLKKA